MKTYSEIPIDKLFYDPTLPTRTWTPEEWQKEFGTGVKGEVKADTNEFDSEILRLYEKEEYSIQGIAAEMGLKWEFVNGRLVHHGVDVSIRARKNRK